MDVNFVVIAVRLGAGALAAVFAIAAWARTRDAPWLFVTLGILASFTEIIWNILQLLGITVPFGHLSVVPFMQTVLYVLSSCFFISACIALLLKKTRV
ncbi:MAG: hypothetical protein LBG79_04945 [Spirochaetaceae bacterium]|nr:hypothetical protein [Spirochaetaceae bacterium]